ncbi:MAG: hypothetical protein KJ587_20000 [Alphaproteobacteria bacterium]|nr:hypothetical protein [Alphaproteobacteria bacterium]
MKTVSISEYAPEITLKGTIQARRESDLAFRTGGRIVERLVDFGDCVAVGAIVVYLDPTEQQTDIQAAAGAIAAANASQNQAQAKYDRQRRFSMPASLLGKPGDRALVAARAAEQRQRADQNVDRRSYCRSVSRNSEPGATVRPGSGCASFGDLDRSTCLGIPKTVSGSGRIDRQTNKKRLSESAARPKHLVLYALLTQPRPKEIL